MPLRGGFGQLHPAVLDRLTMSLPLLSFFYHETDTGEKYIHGTVSAKGRARGRESTRDVDGTFFTAPQMNRLMTRRRLLAPKVEFISPKPEEPVPSFEMAPISPSLLYRRLLKLYVRKFDTDTSTIVKAWKQTKYEFWCARNATAEEADLLNIKGQQIYEAVRAGLIPVYTNPKTGQTYYKYDRDTLDAVHNHIDPVSPEEFIRRFHDRMDPRDVEEIKSTLKDLGRWKGPDELRAEDVYRVKTKRKAKCTDPDPEE